jgi:hypothetical protein
MRAGWAKPKKWKAKDEAYLRRFYARFPLDRLARALRRTPTSVKSRASKLHLDKGYKHRFTPEEDALIRRLYPERVTKDIAKALRLPVYCIYNRARRLGLKKGAELMSTLRAMWKQKLLESGAAFRFRPGLVPANKGLRRPGYSIGRGRMRETQFKKGQRSRNYLPVGTIRPDADGYLRKKIADGPGGFGAPKVWELIHRRTWIDANGPVPAGHAVVFRDCNKRNCALENLELITRRELRIRNSIHRMYPRELASTILEAGVLKRRIREAERGKKQNRRSS